MRAHMLTASATLADYLDETGKPGGVDDRLAPKR
jgi:hypothetical protein